MADLDSSRHSLNVSTSKQKYTFPKTNRFTLERKPLCDSLYQLPTTFSKRATSLGYGNKSLGMVDQKYLPGVGTYNLKGDINPEVKLQQSFSFGVGREKMQGGGPLGHLKFLGSNPAPGTYAFKQMRDSRGPALRSRHPDHEFEKSTKGPGPGAYTLQSIGAKNYYISSRYRNDTNVKISQVSRLDPINKHINKVGPSDYIPVDMLNGSGQYKIAKNHSISSCVFSKSQRPNVADPWKSKVPGPGQYNSFSNFG